MKDMIGNIKRNKVEEVDIPPVIGPDTPPLSHIPPLSLRWSTTNPPLPSTILHYSLLSSLFRYILCLFATAPETSVCASKPVDGRCCTKDPGEP